MVNEAVLQWSLQRMHDVLEYKVSTSGIAYKNFDHKNNGHIEWFGSSLNFLLHFDDDHSQECRCLQKSNTIVVG